MKFSRKRQSGELGISLTSMLDVIFLLLCFFVTISVFSQWENEISIKLPTAGTAEPSDRMPGEVILNLTKEGRVRVNGVELSREDLGSRLAKVANYYPGQPVIIRADREARYEDLISLVDTCRAANIWNFSLATENQ